MAVSAGPLILHALQRAATAPEGLPLVGPKTTALFANQSAGKEAALVCKDRGLVRVVRTETKGRATLEYCTLTEQGWAYLLEHSSPRPIVEALLGELQRSQAGTRELIAVTQRHEQTLDAIRAAVTQLRDHLQKQGAGPKLGGANGQPSPEDVVRENLEVWGRQQPLGDCPLPDLYRRTLAVLPKLTIGIFHDALRRLHEERLVHLHPWTGPLYEMPEPALVLLVGHEIAYYASLRAETTRTV